MCKNMSVEILFKSKFQYEVCQSLSLNRHRKWDFDMVMGLSSLSH